MNEPRWTSEPPTVEGYYWYRSSPASKAYIVELYVAKYGNYAGKLVAEEIGHDGRCPASSYDGEFWPARIEEPSAASQLAIL